MSLTEETEEQKIDRLLQELDIRLPEIGNTGEESFALLPPIDTESTPSTDDISEFLPPPFSS
jgi:hypothetical protein